MGGTGSATTATGIAARIQASRRRRYGGSINLEFRCSEQPESSSSDVEFDFLDEGEVHLAKSSSSDECSQDVMTFEEDEEERDDNGNAEENRSFWDNQHQLLQSTLCRSSSVESRIRNLTKEALKEIQTSETACGCGKQIIAACCRKCLMREVSTRLQNAGYNSAVCKTKWRSSPDLPSGEHNFVDVIDSSSSKKGNVRVIIELNFRGEFEMARANEDYNRLVRRLPEVFVGKAERLTNLIKILCMAGKKCMKEKRMHMGPWRKHRYMQAKWLGPCERNTSTTCLSMGYSEKMPRPKPRASMLTVDLLEKLPNLHVVEVV
ncbi:hypothetical protein L6164_036683 [Bauhinia variegata]|uniref:Uncharacterized protein n=1 Tax=Bauhinia variegata TaxID=167791 RepID=A0ACB9KHP9_BAUVA|nr:hypothetical protein L6164_036683 [Bauhinia variegata]